MTTPTSSSSSSFLSLSSSLIFFPPHQPKQQQHHHPTIFLPIWQQHQQQQQVRYKNKSAKMGQHLQTLNVLAHESERKLAEEKRNSKSKKNKKKNDQNTATTTVVPSTTKNHHPHSRPAATIEVNKSREFDDRDELDDDDDDEEEEHSSEQHQTLLPDPKQVQEKMNKIVRQWEDYLSTVRGSEPTATMFDHIMVIAYGERVPIRSVCQITLEPPNLMKATCYDATLHNAVIEAIRNDDASLSSSLNPYVGPDDSTVLIPIPRMSQESRRDMVHVIKQRAEVYRQRVRAIRRKAMDIIKRGIAKQLEHVSQDDAIALQKQIETLSDDVITSINRTLEHKSQHLLSVS